MDCRNNSKGNKLHRSYLRQCVLRIGSAAEFARVIRNSGSEIWRSWIQNNYIKVCNEKETCSRYIRERSLRMGLAVLVEWSNGSKAWREWHGLTMWRVIKILRKNWNFAEYVRQHVVYICCIKRDTVENVLCLYSVSQLMRARARVRTFEIRKLRFTILHFLCRHMTDFPRGVNIAKPVIRNI